MSGGCGGGTVGQSQAFVLWAGRPIKMDWLRRLKEKGFRPTFYVGKVGGCWWRWRWWRWPIKRVCFVTGSANQNVLFLARKTGADFGPHTSFERLFVVRVSCTRSWFYLSISIRLAFPYDTNVILHSRVGSSKSTYTHAEPVTFSCGQLAKDFSRLPMVNP